MPRMTASKSLELETFWRAHLDGWRRSDLNQREYFALHGLPLKRFGNWRARLKHEDDVPRQKLLWRRGGGLNSPLKKAPLTGFHATSQDIAAKAVSPSSETMRTI